MAEVKVLYDREGQTLTVWFALSLAHCTSHSKQLRRDMSTIGILID